MRLDYFRIHRDCHYIATCGCGRIFKDAPRAPFAATRLAAGHARRFAGHSAWVFDMTCLNTVSHHVHEALPIDVTDPPF